MITAPAISSILSPEYLAKFAVIRYGFDSGTTCQMLKTGINHSYLIATSDKNYVLRVYFYNWRTEREIAEELRLLEYLKENGILVSFPVEDKNGNHIQRVKAYEGERFAVLFTFAEGENIRNPSEKICYQLGTTIAKMHLFTVNKAIDRKHYNAETLAGWAFHLAKSHFSNFSDEMQYFERATSIISSEFNNAESESLRKGIVHLDLWHDNMKIKGESEITIFDFDNCGNGWLFLDIAYSLMLLFRNEPDKECYKKKRDSFYQGYESVTLLPKEEKRLMPYGGLAIWLHYTGIHVKRFDDFSNQFLSEDFLKYWIHTVNQWMEFNGIKI